MRVILAGLLLLTLTSCATHALLFPTVVEEYPAARVRIYRSGLRCRVEVMTPTAILQTVPTQCVTVPHRQMSHEP